MDDIESKIDQLLELYMEDRKRFLTIPHVQQTSPIVTSTITSTTTSTTAVLKPKPILVDKQLSEPSSPITKTFKDPPPATVSRRPMQRGFSDLGNRIKKRVTLRFQLTLSNK